MTYWERLKYLKMNSQQRRFERYKVFYTWKVINGLVPNPGICLLPDSDRRGILCKVPATKDNMRNNSYQVIGPRLFNALPKELRNMKCSKADFKFALDTFLCKIPDEPQCPNLVPGATDMIESKPSNSLLHQIPRAWREQLLLGWRDTSCWESGISDQSTPLC